MKKNMFPPRGKGFCFPKKWILIMKLTTILLSISLLHITANTFSQNSRMSINLENASIKEVLKEIEKNSEFRFLYRNEGLSNKRVDINKINSTLEEILAETLEGTSADFMLLDENLVVIVPGDRKNQEGITITGEVLDVNGTSLPGVNIVEVGTTNGAVTDLDGNFSITVASKDATLQFSYVGYLTEDIKVGDKAILEIILIQDIQALDEVVVVGYGSQKRVNLTGSIGVATAEKLENRPITTVGSGLQGVIPNLNVSIKSGDPSQRADYNIRGFESINGGSPLILVDGVPMQLDAINPSDIASVNVLKDAAAAAVYGARAAFGVILVETKQGKQGIRVNFNAEYGLSSPIYNFDQISDAYEFAVEKNRVYMDNVGRLEYSEEQIANLKRYHDNPIPENEWGVNNGRLEYYGNSDIENYVLTDFAPQQKYDISVSGASEKTNYYVSFGYLNNKGYLRNDEDNLNYDRYNLLLKGDYEVMDWLTLDTKIAVNAENNDEPHFYHNARKLNTLIRYTPTFNPIKFPDLEYYLEPGDHDDYAQYIGMYMNGARAAPFFDLGGRDLSEKYDTWLTQGFTLTPLKGLRIRGEYSQQIYVTKTENQQTNVPMVQDNNLTNMQITFAQSSNDYIENSSSLDKYNVFNTYGEYTWEGNDNHYLKLMAGFNQEWGRKEYIYAKALGLSSQNILDLSATSGDQQTDGSKSEVALRGAFYRLNYIYKDKYLFETNGRYDLSSRFPKKDRAGFFPSFSAGWRISEETFMDWSQNWLDNLKLRASYGTLGNQLLGNNYYPYIASMGLGQREFIFDSGLVPYASPAGLVSSTLTWETVTTKNIGLDITVLNQRLNVSFDAYIRETENMLMRQSYPDILGASSPRTNAADLETKGWELNVNWHDRVGQDWSYGMDLSLWDNTAKITKYENPTGAFSDYYVGKTVGEIWGFETYGLFQSDEEVTQAPDQSQIGTGWKAGDVRYVDLNGDGEITFGSNTLDDPGDRKIIGNENPRYSFGIRPEVSYQNLSLSLFLQGYLRRHYYPNPAQKHTGYFPYTTDSFDKRWREESWSEENPDAYWPRPRYMRIVNTKQNFEYQTRYLQNVGYIRLKSLTLSYMIPKTLTGKLGINSAQIYFAGMNLWEATRAKIKVIDPEYIYTTQQDYYLQRTYSMGIKLGF